MQCVALAVAPFDHQLLRHGALVLVGENMAVQHDHSVVNVGPVTHYDTVASVSLHHVVPVACAKVDVLVGVAQAVHTSH